MVQLPTDPCRSPSLRSTRGGSDGHARGRGGSEGGIASALHVTQQLLAGLAEVPPAIRRIEVDLIAKSGDIRPEVRLADRVVEVAEPARHHALLILGSCSPAVTRPPEPYA